MSLVIKKINKRWRGDTLEKRKEQARNWRNKNKIHHNAYLNKWRSDHRKDASVILIALRSHAKKQKFIIDLPLKDFKKWVEESNHKCAYCDILEKDLDKAIYMNKFLRKRLSIDRINNKEGYSVKNITWACHLCNKYKNNIFTFKEMRRAAQREIKPLWQKLIKN